MVPISGTLEGTGPGKGGTTSAPCKDYGYNGITANASTSPPLRGSLMSNGINGSVGDKGASLVNSVDGSADTTMYQFPEGGTVESNGANG